jgi:hypothetical protein
MKSRICRRERVRPNHLTQTTGNVLKQAVGTNAYPPKRTVPKQAVGTNALPASRSMMTTTQANRNDGF